MSQLSPAVFGQVYKPETMAGAMDAALYLTKFKTAAQASGGYTDMLTNPDWAGTIFAPVDQVQRGLAQSLLHVVQCLRTSSTLNAHPPCLMQAFTGPDVAAEFASDNSTKAVGFHVVPGTMEFPLSMLTNGALLNTSIGLPLLVDRR